VGNEPAQSGIPRFGQLSMFEFKMARMAEFLEAGGRRAVHSRSESEPSKQHKNDDDDQDGANDANAAVAEAVTVAAELATEAAEQEDDEKNDEDQSDRHGVISFVGQTLR
jgi:hypothetical protein